MKIPDGVRVIETSEIVLADNKDHIYLKDARSFLLLVDAAAINVLLKKDDTYYFFEGDFAVYIYSHSESG